MTDAAAIRCMQLPLLDFQLLLPNSAVAEIIGYSLPEDANDKSDWYKGQVPWRGVMVPVVSVEQMCEQSTLEPGPRTRLAIIYNPSADSQIPYLGLILQDIPRAYLAEQERLMEGLDVVDCQFLVSRADVLVDQLVIPDLDAIIASVQQRVSH